MNDQVAECRAAAREAGIRWSWVVARKNVLVALEREKREGPEGVRREAWRLACYYSGWAESRADWWTVGFQRCFPRITRTGEADFTSIPRYDRIASAIALEWPEFAPEHEGDVGATERLFDFLLTPYQPWPPRERFYWEALEEILATGSTAEAGPCLASAAF